MTKIRTQRSRKQGPGILLALCFGLLISAPLSATQSKTQPSTSATQEFSGEITDTFCAKNGSHDTMMNELKNMGHNKKSCAVQCVQLGAKYVLYDAGRKTIYSLDDQDKAAAFAGQRVRVMGTLEKKKIKVESIEAAGEQVPAQP
jgi:hypothetical protein